MPVAPTRVPLHAWRAAAVAWKLSAAGEPRLRSLAVEIADAACSRRRMFSTALGCLSVVRAGPICYETMRRQSREHCRRMELVGPLQAEREDPLFPDGAIERSPVFSTSSRYHIMI